MKTNLGLMLVGALAVVAATAQAQAPAPAAQGGGANGPCRQIVQACEAAGFMKGDAKAGKGLVKDCMKPIMNGGAAPQGVTVSPATVAACKTAIENKHKNAQAPAGAH